MRSIRAFCLGLLMLCALRSFAGTNADAERELVGVDRARAQAMVLVDATALERLLGDDLSYGHSSGQVQNKSEFIDSLSSGVLKYKALASQEAAGRVYGCAGVVTGIVQAEVEMRGHPASLTLRYAATYAKRGERWVLVAYQSTKLQ